MENPSEAEVQVPSAEDFAKKEAELQQTISNLKLLNEKLILRNDETSKENEVLKKRLTKMELETNVGLDVPQSEAVKVVKEKYENILTKAKAMIFEGQKTIQQQVNQIEAYKVQISALQEVTSLTKEMLNIRNMENENFQAKFETIDIKFQAQNERCKLMEKKSKVSEQLNADLKNEYLAQKKTFNLLKDQYKTKIATLEKELAKLKNQPNGVH